MLDDPQLVGLWFNLTAALIKDTLFSWAPMTLTKYT